MKAHPAAALFPMLPDEELQSLADDIKTNGLLSPIVVIDGKGEWLILDGRNRARACELANVRAETVVWAGKDPVSFVVSTNLHRRHLTSSQRAMVAAEIAKLKNGERGPARKKASQICEAFPASQAEAAAQLKVSKRSVESARRVKDDGAEELIAAVVDGSISVSAGAELSKLPKDEQRAVVAQGKKAVASKAKDVRAKAAPSEPVTWDSWEFLGEIGSQIEDWRTEWLKHATDTRVLVQELRLIVNVMEKENAHLSTRVG